MSFDEAESPRKAPEAPIGKVPNLNTADAAKPQPALTIAREFLHVLDSASRVWDFRTFDDDPGRGDPRLTRVFSATLEEAFPQLVRLNELGAGVFVTINCTDGRGIKASNIHRIRALFADTDGADVRTLLGLKPHMVVRSSPGKYHCYWLVDGCDVSRFKPTMKAIAAKFGTDSRICDPSRVMRLPGLFHSKGDPFLVDFDRDLMKAEDADCPSYSVDHIITGLGLEVGSNRVDSHSRAAGTSAKAGAAKRRNGFTPPPAETMRAMLEHLTEKGHFEDRTGIQIDDQGRITKLGWIETGMALKLAYGDVPGQDLWAITHLDERAPGDAPGQWASFAEEEEPGQITIGTIIKAARDAGYVDAASQETITIDLFLAFMPTHQYIFAPTGELWPAASVNGRLPAIVIEASADGEPETISPARWLDRNKAIEQMTWAPGEPQVIRDRLAHEGELVEHVGASCFNLYRPPAPRAGGDANAVAPWVDHIRKVYPDEADHIIQWLAHRVQRPQEKINHALVLGGVQGIGKDTILAPVKEAVGTWNFQEASPQNVIGRFNGFLKAVVLRISEARDLGDVNRFQFYDHMKTYTSSPPETLRLDEKNLREYYVRNCCGVILTTNHKTDGIYLPPDDRRHFVAWSVCAKDEFLEQYWNSLWRWYEYGGLAHVAAYLSAVDLSSFDSKASPPKTPAFWEIVDANRAPEDAELADAIDAIGRPEALTLDSLSTSWIFNTKNRRVIPHRLERCGYAPVRNEAAADGLWKVRQRRMAIYAKTELPQRERLRAAHALLGK